MKLVVEIDLTKPDQQNLGFVIPLMATILTQLTENCSPDLHMIDDVLGDREEGLLIETADTMRKSEIGPSYANGPEVCNARITVSREPFDTYIRTHDLAKQDGCDAVMHVSEFEAVR